MRSRAAICTTALTEGMRGKTGAERGRKERGREVPETNIFKREGAGLERVQRGAERGREQRRLKQTDPRGARGNRAEEAGVDKEEGEVPEANRFEMSSVPRA